MTPRAAAWSAERIAEIRRCVASAPSLAREDGYREWSYRFGAVYTRRTHRAAVCAGCAAKIPPGTEALYVVYTETPSGGWTPQKRFLHLDTCGGGS